MGRYEWNAHFSGSCLTAGDWARDLSTTGTVKLIGPATTLSTDPVWSTTMTVAEIRANWHGYLSSEMKGALDDDDFEYGSPAVSYTVQQLAVGTNTVSFIVDQAGLPESDTLTLELAGHEFPFSARNQLTTDTATRWFWGTPEELDRPTVNFPVGTMAPVCLRTATQVCPSGDMMTPLSTDATLSALSLGSGVTLIPTFASSTAAYTASVANSVSEVTVTPTTNHASADSRNSGRGRQCARGRGHQCGRPPGGAGGGRETRHQGGGDGRGRQHLAGLHGDGDAGGGDDRQ